MLTVHTITGSVERDREKKNGSIQSRYQGYTTGAHKNDAATGQANASGVAALASLAGGANASVPTRVVDFLLIQTAVRKPMSTVSPATSSGAATRSKIANTGSLKRKLWM